MIMDKKGILYGVLLLASLFVSALYGSAHDAGALSQPTNRTNALNRLNDLCRTNPVAHAGYATNISLNRTSGAVTYTLNIVYKRCPGSGSTALYAVTGYPRSGGGGNLTICPYIGRYNYGTSNPIYDCIKHIVPP